MKHGRFEIMVSRWCIRSWQFGGNRCGLNEPDSSNAHPLNSCLRNVESRFTCISAQRRHISHIPARREDNEYTIVIVWCTHALRTRVIHLSVQCGKCWSETRCNGFLERTSIHFFRPPLSLHFFFASRKISLSVKIESSRFIFVNFIFRLAELCFLLYLFFNFVESWKCVGEAGK